MTGVQTCALPISQGSARSDGSRYARAGSGTRSGGAVSKLTLRQLCCVAYVSLVDLVESRSQSLMVASLIAKSQGADVTIQTPHEAREEFDAALIAPIDREGGAMSEKDIVLAALFPKM